MPHGNPSASGRAPPTRLATAHRDVPPEASSWDQEVVNNHSGTCVECGTEVTRGDHLGVSNASVTFALGFTLGGGPGPGLEHAFLRAETKASLNQYHVLSDCLIMVIDMLSISIFTAALNRNIGVRTPRKVSRRFLHVCVPTLGI